MSRTNARKLILSSGIVASVALFIWMVTSGLDVTTVYGAPLNLSICNKPTNIIKQFLLVIIEIQLKRAKNF
jgi:hypothetical protein